MKLHHCKRILAAVLCVLLAGASLSPIRVQAAASGTPKEEVVYASLNADGTVREINVVNIFDLARSGRITDYGDYQNVRNMTTTDAIEYADGTVTIDASGTGKLYYEGKLAGTALPWDIEIHYDLDGKEYTPDALAGKSGALKITVSISQPRGADSTFFDAYALQASLTLDTERCSNIRSDNATIANVGSNKQLTYIILPGKGAEIEITADVTDFSMDGISLNGIPLNLEIEIDDEALMEQVSALQDAIAQIDDGASELQDGAASLQQGGALQDGIDAVAGGAASLQSGSEALTAGGNALRGGAGQLESGAAALDDGVQALYDGIAQMQAGLDALNAQSPALTDGSAAFLSAMQELQTQLGSVTVAADDLSLLTEASSAIQTGIDELTAGAEALEQGVSFQAYQAVMLENGLDLDALRENNAAAAQSIQSIVDILNQQLGRLQSIGIDTTLLSEQVNKLQNLALLYTANNAALGGMESYLNAVSANLTTLADGARTLQSSYAEFDGSIQALVDSLGALAGQAALLTDAVNTLVAEYENLDSGITAYTDGVAQIVAGCRQISGGSAQVAAGSSALRSGTQTLYDNTGALLDGLTALYEGSGTLADGSGQLSDGAAALIAGLAQLYDGTSALSSGTSALRSETDGMDTAIDAEIDRLLSAFTGGDSEIPSFTSARNTDVARVQFVIKTDGIRQEEAPVEEPEEETPTFWEKFLALFGID